MKTIEQFIEKLKKSPLYEPGDDHLVKASIEFAQRWIPIEEFEMKEGEKILVKCLHGWTTGRLKTQKNGKKKLSNCVYPIEIITHCRKIEVE
jgi:hypothetical protein